MNRQIPRYFFLLLLISARAQAEELSSTELSPPPLHLFNFQIKPVALVCGVPGAALEIGILKWMSLGFSFDFLQGGGTRAIGNAKQAEVSLSFFPGGQRFQDDWFGRMIVGLDAIQSNASTRAASRTTGSSDLQLVLGHSWAFTSVGFNTTLGAGVLRSFAWVSGGHRDDLGLGFSLSPVLLRLVAR
jgi:hypothetical protein